MNEAPKHPPKKESTLMKEILQVLTILITGAYTFFYFYFLLDHETVIIDFSFYKHLFLIGILATGLFFSFKNTLISGVFLLFYAVFVAISVFIGNYAIDHVTEMATNTA